MLELKVLQAKKAELSKKQKDGDTSEDTRKELAKVESDLLTLSEEMKNMLAAKPAAATKTEEAAGPSHDATKAAVTTEEVAYVPKAGTEGKIHAELTKGQRFDPQTGKELSTPFIQLFDKAEFENFKKHAKVLGYAVKVVYEPKK